MTHNNLLYLLKPFSHQDRLDYNELFNTIAKDLLSNYVIEKGIRKYTILEIEFYLYSKYHPDVITYPRFIEAGQWYFHQSGVDLTFESNEKYFGGILIRGIKDLSNGNMYLGPLKCMDVLWDNFNAFTPMIDEIPHLQYIGEGSNVEIHRYKRWIPARDEEKTKKISYWLKRIEQHSASLPCNSIDELEKLVFNSYYRFSSIPLEVINGYSSKPKITDRFS